MTFSWTLNKAFWATKVVTIDFYELKAHCERWKHGQQRGTIQCFWSDFYYIDLIYQKQSWNIADKEGEGVLLYSSPLPAFQGELIASELRLFSHGPLVRLILTRWRASDEGTGKCASGSEAEWRKHIQKNKKSVWCIWCALIYFVGEIEASSLRVQQLQLLN